MDTKRTNVERSEETRAALMAAAHESFTERGYTDTSTETIVERARVTRGALYYHFKDKADLFRNVFFETDQSLNNAIAQSIERAEGNEWQRVMTGTRTFLESCSAPDIQRILYVDGPVILGTDWPSPMGLDLIRQSIALLMSRGYLVEQPIEPLTHLICGSLTYGALYIVRADDKRTAREEVEYALLELFNGLRVQAPSTRP